MLVILVVALGFLAGYFFTITPLIGITIIAVWGSVYLHSTRKEIEVLGAWAYDILVVIVMLVMWITYYIASNQHWLGDVLGRGILR